MKEKTMLERYTAKGLIACVHGYSSRIVNARYKELIAEMRSNGTIEVLISMIGEALDKEEETLQAEVIEDIMDDSDSTNFDESRNCLTCSREMIITIHKLMGWLP